MLKIKIGGGPSEVPGSGQMDNSDKLRALDFLEEMVDDARAKLMGDDMPEEKEPSEEMSEDEERDYLSKE